MTRFQHLYYFLHHDIYSPLSPSISPYSLEIVRSLTFCSNATPSNDPIDFFCANKTHLPTICKLVTIDGFWSPKDPTNGQCRWKIGHPLSTPPKSTLGKDPLIVAVLPPPDIYLWRLWLHQSSLSPSDTQLNDRQFRSWALRQSKSPMLDALFPEKNKRTNTRSRIPDLIRRMRAGEALILTETLARQLHDSEGLSGVEKWLSAHLGFFLHLPPFNITSDVKPSISLNSTWFDEDSRFYAAIEAENQRWTKRWNFWRHTFLRRLINT